MLTIASSSTIYKQGNVFPEAEDAERASGDNVVNMRRPPNFAKDCGMFCRDDSFGIYLLVPKRLTRNECGTVFRSHFNALTRGCWLRPGRPRKLLRDFSGFDSLVF